MSIEVTSDSYQSPRSGLLLLYGLVIFLFLLLVLRFWYLQMLSGEDFARQALQNRHRQQQIYATRGIIRDTQGTLLAENRPAYCLAITREDCQDIPATLAQISKWTNTPLATLQAKFQQDAKSVQPFEPQLISADISFEQVTAIEEQLFQWPGVSIVTRQRRYYPQNKLLAHILGYVAEANAAEVSTDKTLSLGDRIGKLGLEYTLEQQLRGTKGKTVVEVDALGRPLRKLEEHPPVAGTNFTVSLDIALQEAAVNALGEESGCIVVMDPETGKLRALVSHPSFDNNLFTARLSEKDWNALNNDTRHPMHNRAIQSVYPPGSVWKLMMAGLFLHHKINPKETVTCTGSVTLGNQTFRCWNSGGHGVVNMMRSLVESCDVYYYEMSQRIGINNIEAFAKLCGFGQKTGIDLPHERAGLVPGRAWKLANRDNEEWLVGETLNVSIGQGYTLVTPVQMAVFVSALINGGRLLKPSLLEEEPVIKVNDVPIPAAHRAFILESMRITAESGTAKKIRRSDATMGGKTGTAQVVTMRERRRLQDIAYQHRDHAWLASWGIKDGKSFVVIVIVEHGGGGSSAAAPVCAKVYESLFGPPPEQKKIPVLPIPTPAPEH